MDRCENCGVNLYAGVTTTMKPIICWNCGSIIEDSKLIKWVKYIPEVIQKESEIIIANAGLNIAFTRCKITPKLKGKLKRKDFLKLKKQEYLNLLKKLNLTTNQPKSNFFYTSLNRLESID